MSLRRRLLLGLVTIAAVLVVTNLTLANRYESFLLDRVDRQLIDVASRPVFRGERGPGRRGPDEETLSEYFIAVGNPLSGEMHTAPSAFADERRPPPKLVAADITTRAQQLQPEPFNAGAQSGSGTWRLIAVQNPRFGDVTVVGLSLSEIAATMDRMRAVQALGTLAVLATLGLVSWWVLRLGLHPLEDMAVAADAIAAGDLSRRVTPPSAGTEAGRLAVAFNAMLERIQQAFREREASEERVRRFAADASHELRTPLTSILGYAELYRAGGLRAKDELGGAMARMEQEGHRMAALVEDLLQLARLDQHREPERVHVQLDELAEDAVRDARAVEPDRPITSELAPVAVEADSAQLRQVLGNLLSNARLHTPPGTPVHVRVAKRGATAVLEVADEGPGMEPAVAEKVFDRFFRVDASRARAAGGTGLGLAIVEGVVTAHGGRVRVESSPGKGSRFVVELRASGS
ncbi:MAG TPA: HAMP domain-containing sensor histidine kinase [Acidimicrobiales bacterium]|nr:HAMP domain-containing sensor histidine kinase [Acidimicrobiales bacterium]